MKESYKFYMQYQIYFSTWIHMCDAVVTDSSWICYNG